MKHIWKYNLPVQPGRLSIPVMGTQAKPLHVALQFNDPVLWAEVDGTILFDQGRFVLHYYVV